MEKNMFFVNLYDCPDVKGDLSEMFALMKRENITGLQLSYDELLRLDRNLFKKLLDENGVRIVCLHVVARLCAKDDAIFDEAVKLCCDALEYVSFFGCEFLMPVPFFPSDIESEADRLRARERFVKGLKIITKESEKYNIKTVIENISQLILPFSSCDDLEYILDSVPNLNFCFDTGNFVCTKDDNLKAYEQLRKRINLVHIKELVSCDDGDVRCDSGAILKHTDFGMGDANLDIIMKKLISSNPKVPYIIEIQNSHAQMNWVIQASRFFEEMGI